MDNADEVRQFADGEVYMWIEQGASIHLKAASAFGDPTELTAEDAREIARSRGVGTTARRRLASRAKHLTQKDSRWAEAHPTTYAHRPHQSRRRE